MATMADPKVVVSYFVQEWGEDARRHAEGVRAVLAFSGLSEEAESALRDMARALEATREAAARAALALRRAEG